MCKLRDAKCKIGKTEMGFGDYAKGRGTRKKLSSSWSLNFH
jgi:hypothetical protein